jgi:hypothetical protein
MHSASLCADRTLAPAAAPAARHPGLHRLHASLVAWWHGWRRHEHERAEAATLASLSPGTLQDIGLADAVHLHALAQRESQYERLTRTVSELGGHAGRFGPW